MNVQYIARYFSIATSKKFNIGEIFTPSLININIKSSRASSFTEVNIFVSLQEKVRAEMHF